MVAIALAPPRTKNRLAGPGGGDEWSRLSLSELIDINL